MKKIPVLLVIVAGSILVSCQKELSNSQETEEPQTERQLNKVTYTYDHQFIDSFEYDAQKRVSRYVTIHYDLTNPNPQPYIYFHEFYYNGNETLPYKITDTSQGRGSVWFIKYDTQKRKIADSQVYFGSGEEIISRYAYSGNRIIATTTYNSPSSNSIYKDTFDYDGSNVIRYGAGEDGASTYDWQNAMTYDTRVNPISKLNIATSVLFGANGTLGTSNGLNKNNVLTEKYSSRNSPTTTMTYQYVYDAENYPLSGTFVSPNIQGTVKFDYKK